MTVQVTIETDPTKFDPKAAPITRDVPTTCVCAAPTSPTPPDAVTVGASLPDQEPEPVPLDLEASISEYGVSIAFDCRRVNSMHGQSGEEKMGVEFTRDEFENFINVMLGLWSCYNPPDTEDPEK